MLLQRPELRLHQRQATAHLPGRGISIVESSFGSYARDLFNALVRVGPFRARSKEMWELLLRAAGASRRRACIRSAAPQKPCPSCHCCQIARPGGFCSVPILSLSKARISRLSSLYPLSNPYPLVPMSPAYMRLRQIWHAHRLRRTSTHTHVPIPVFGTAFFALCRSLRHTSTISWERHIHQTRRKARKEEAEAERKKRWWWWREGEGRDNKIWKVKWSSCCPLLGSLSVWAFWKEGG